MVGGNGKQRHVGFAGVAVSVFWCGLIERWLDSYGGSV
jgi:hypothetical protein